MIYLQFKCNNQTIGRAVSAEGRENNVKLKKMGFQGIVTPLRSS